MPSPVAQGFQENPSCYSEAFESRRSRFCKRIKDHPLYRKDSLFISDLRNAPIINNAAATGSHCRQLFNDCETTEIQEMYFDNSDDYDFNYEDYSSEEVTSKEMHDFICRHLAYKSDCEQRLNESWVNRPENETWCRGEFDGYMCWSHGRAGQMLQESCPDYVGFENSSSLFGHRSCTANGTWREWTVDGERVIWQNRQDCSPVNSNYYADVEVDNKKAIFSILTIIYTTGYVISLICLVVALFLLGFFKKLHCTRNYIHMNLMLSFMVRYIVVMIKDKVIGGHYDVERDMPSPENLASYCDDASGVSGLMITCRLTITLMHYAIIANYFWLLAEGIYLHMLLVFTMADHKFFPWFMAFGWGGPWLPVMVWVALRLSLENEGCWEIFDHLSIWWSLKAPVIAAIAINFIIFINIVRIIVSKLRANNMPQNDYKYRLARSTLALIPLLGIHYIIFLAVTDEVVGFDNPTLHVKLYLELVSTSIQGMLIAILYCFCNGEVQAEIGKVWKNWRWRRSLPTNANTSRTNSTYPGSGTQVTSLYVNSEAPSTNHHDQLLVPEHVALSTRRSTSDSVANSLPCKQPLMGNGRDETHDEPV